MTKRINRCLIKHASFDTYLKIARCVKWIERNLDRARLFFFVRTKDGAPLRGMASSRPHHMVIRALIRCLPLAIVLAAALFVPLFLPETVWEHLPEIYFELANTTVDASYVAGFIAAILAIAGIFLTLFYANVTTVFSNRFPSSSGSVTRLFVELVSSDKDLGYCTSFVIVALFSFVACAMGIFNWVAILCFVVFSVALVLKLPNVFSLGTRKTDITAVSAIPANRFLALARASSFESSFYDSDYLIRSFKELASIELALLDDLMEYCLTSGGYSQPYSKAVNEVVLTTLSTYSQISSSIGTESLWHAESRVHKKWFMSPFYEVDLAISTGTILQPDMSVDRFGYHKELRRISMKFGSYLIDNNRIAEYSSFVDFSRLVLGICIENGDIEWSKDYLKELLTQCLNFCQLIDGNSKESLRAKCHLLEQCSVTLLTVPLELGKLCDGVSCGAFHFDSFDTFSQVELRKQGFPLGDNVKMSELCKKLKYEKDVFGKVETPEWWFDNEVDSVGLEVIERLCSDVLLLYELYCSLVKDLVVSDPKSSYILALKETELFRKSEQCLNKLRLLAITQFHSEGPLQDCIPEIESIHHGLAGIYPELAELFMRDRAEFEAFFPDLYGFAFFNYCQLQFDDVINNRLDSFCSSVISLYRLSVVSLQDLQDAVLDGCYNDFYKMQVLSEPTVLFIELCGMAYAMAELHEDLDSQRAIRAKILGIVRDDPKTRARWEACMDLGDNLSAFFTNGIDLLSWRRRFSDAVMASGRYPDVPLYPAGAKGWKPPVGKERLLNMLPGINRSPNGFSGCGVFKKYVLGSDGRDE